MANKPKPKPKKSDRSHWFLVAGALLLFIGTQLALVESFALRPGPTRFLANWSNVSSRLFVRLTGQGATVEPPEWLAWACLSAGAALAVHGVICVWRK